MLWCFHKKGTVGHNMWDMPRRHVPWFSHLGTKISAATRRNSKRNVPAPISSRVGMKLSQGKCSVLLRFSLKTSPYRNILRQTQRKPSVFRQCLPAPALRPRKGRVDFQELSEIVLRRPLQHLHIVRGLWINRPCLLYGESNTLPPAILRPDDIDVQLFNKPILISDQFTPRSFD